MSVEMALITFNVSKIFGYVAFALLLISWAMTLILAFRKSILVGFLLLIVGPTIFPIFLFYCRPAGKKTIYVFLASLVLFAVCIGGAVSVMNSGIHKLGNDVTSAVMSSGDLQRFAEKFAKTHGRFPQPTEITESQARRSLEPGMGYRYEANADTARIELNFAGNGKAYLQGKTLQIEGKFNPGDRTTTWRCQSDTVMSLLYRDPCKSWVAERYELFDKYREGSPNG